MEDPQAPLVAEWIAGSLIAIADIDDRELRLSVGWDAANVTVELIREDEPAVWLATVTRLGRRQHGRPLAPCLRSNHRYAHWIGADDFDTHGTDAREAIRRAGERLWIAVAPDRRRGYYQH